MSRLKAGRTSGFAHLRGGPRLYYEIGPKRNGVPLVLVRGLGRSSAYWLEFRDRLELERTVLVLDNRGVGRSDAPRPGYGTFDMADDVAAVLRATGLERADVFGISMGGMIAQHLAIRHPHRVRRLVLAATTVGRRRGRAISLPVAFGLLRSATLPLREAIRQSARLALSPEALARSPEIVDIWIAIAESEPASRKGVIGQMFAAARHDTSQLLPYLRAETLVITGDADALIHHDNSRVLADSLPRATLEVIAGAGHDIPTERPLEMAERVLRFTAD